ncbi:MAG: dihydroorotase [Candidatus Firestonebacteria bacterium]
MKIIIKDGRVIDPANKIDANLDILIEGEKISKVSKNISSSSAKIIDAKGKVVCPGLIDMHVHLREPGEEHKETIATGTLSALNGGFTSVACMPNTNPVLDDKTRIEFILSKAKSDASTNVFPIASITKEAKGEELSNIGELKEAGAVALSDDAHPLMNAEVMRRAMEYSKMFGLSIIAHCEDINMTHDGVMNEGFTSTILGLRGMPKAAEEIIVSRNIILAEWTGCNLHIAHVSTAGAVEMIRLAKKRKVRVTAETAPHYFTLTQEAVKGYNTNAKMNPPLREDIDVKAIKEGLKDGTIDCIASDHAPHTSLDKECEFNYASFGIIGMETTLSLVITELVNKKILSLSDAIKKLTINPARILNINRGTLSEGSIADITIIDVDKEWTVDVNKFASKAKNSPFNGWKLLGLPYIVIIGGKIQLSEK